MVSAVSLRLRLGRPRLVIACCVIPLVVVRRAGDGGPVDGDGEVGAALACRTRSRRGGRGVGPGARLWRGLVVGACMVECVVMGSWAGG